MSDEWMASLKLKLSRKEFETLPRHPAYKYELIDGVAYLSPWPRYYHAHLDLKECRIEAEAIDDVTVRPARAEDLQALIPVFLAAFAWTQPYGSLSDEAGEEAARRALTQTFTGGDGPWVEPASFVVLHERRIVGAIFITLVPGGDPADSDGYRWHDPAPENLWDQRRGQPHLTWIFVRQFSQGVGIGSRLLAEAVRVLKDQQYESLWTTFMFGNDSSMLWHWRNGFTLAPYPFTKRSRLRDLRP